MKSFVLLHGRATCPSLPGETPLGPACHTDRWSPFRQFPDVRRRVTPCQLRRQARLAALLSGLVATLLVRAPGRVNLIGEHTDYNDGFVLPAAISLDIRLTVAPNDAGRVDITLAQ